MGCPISPIVAGIPVEFSYTRVLGKEMDKSLSFDPPRLRVGHLFFTDQLKHINAVGFQTSILEPGGDDAPGR